MRCDVERGVNLERRVRSDRPRLADVYGLAGYNGYGQGAYNPD